MGIQVEAAYVAMAMRDDVRNLILLSGVPLQQSVNPDRRPRIDPDAISGTVLLACCMVPGLSSGGKIGAAPLYG